MNAFLHQPGFLGTSANMAADLTLVWMLIILGLFTIGAWLALRKNYAAHRWVQTSAALLNLGLVLWMMILPFRDFVVQDQGGPRPGYFYMVTGLHALAGSAAVLLGMFVVLRANGLMIPALRFRNYKAFMRAAYGLYLLATLLGVAVYLVWFVFIPNPPLY